MLSRAFLAQLVCVAVLGAQQTPPSAPADGPARAVIAETCIDCHSGADADGGFDLRVLDQLDAVGRFARLLEVRDRVRRREMPPTDFGTLDEIERDAILAWVAHETRDLQLLPLPTGSAGAPQLRRLSRFEYENTIRDLFGVECDATSAFPAAALGHGFDNAAGVGALSALHLEKYLDAAAEVAAAVVDTARFDAPPTPSVPLARLSGSDLEIDASVGSPRGDAAVLASAGRLSGRIVLPRGGRYRAEIVSYGDQAGDEPPRMVVTLAGRIAAEVSVSAVQSEPQRDRIEFDVADGASACEVRLEFVNDFWNPDHADPEQRDRNLCVESIEVFGPLDDCTPAGSAWFFASDPGVRQSVQRRASAFAKALLERAWRAPARPADVKRFARLCADAVTDGASFGEGLRTMLEAALVAPQFVYRIEATSRARPAATSDATPLAGHEIAARLSYFLWASAPDATLREARVQRQLASAEQRVLQARRMLQDSRTASAFAAGFASQWLELRNLATLEFDPTRFPEVDAPLRESMHRETSLLVETVLRENLPIVTLCDADFTFVDARLAAHYGILFEGDTPTAFVRMPAPRAAGVLGHASVLALTSNPTRTSPVKRGRWILDNLLGAPPPPPEPGADSFADESALHVVASMREQLAAHRRNPECAACHDRLDGLGLALEGFDAIGRIRAAADDQLPIDVSGVLPGGVTIEGLGGVRDVLIGGPDFVRCAITKLWTYAFGRAPTPVDELRIELLMREHADWSRITFEDAILGIVASPAFVAAATSTGGGQAGARPGKLEEDR